MSPRSNATLLTLFATATLAWSPFAMADRDGPRNNDRHYRSQDSGHRNPGWNQRGNRNNQNNRNHRNDGDSSDAILGLGLAVGAGLLWLGTHQNPAPPRPAPVYVSMDDTPPVVIAPPPPRYAPAPAPAWYYCRSAGAYYPYVQTCRTPWEVVPTQ